MIAVALVVGLAVLTIFVPLAIYTFLVFPNFDGVIHNVTWYKYDSNSQHFLYWTGFWTIVLFGAKATSSSVNKKSSNRMEKQS